MLRPRRRAPAPLQARFDCAAARCSRARRIAAHQASFLVRNYREDTGWETSSASSGSGAGPSASGDVREVPDAFKKTNWAA